MLEDETLLDDVSVCLINLSTFMYTVSISITFKSALSTLLVLDA